MRLFYGWTLYEKDNHAKQKAFEEALKIQLTPARSKMMESIAHLGAWLWPLMI
jgi:hypothetical protein